MRTQNHTTRTYNTPVAKRRTASAVSSGSSLTKRPRSASRNSKRKSDHRKYGSRVIGLLMILGGMIAGGFVLAQRSQINAHQLKRVEEMLKSEMDTLSSQQRYLLIQKDRALSTQESDRAAKESGLVQIRLDRANAQQAKIQPEPRAESKPAAKPATQSSKLSGKKLISQPPARSARPSGKPAQSSKTAKVKSAQAGKPALKPKTSQMARNQAPRKGASSKDKRH